MEKFEQFIQRAELRVKSLRERFQWLKPGEVERLIDHTLLKPYASLDDIKTFFIDGSKFNFASYCVNSAFVRYLKKLSEDYGVDTKICAVVGFPLGAMVSSAKAYEAELAVKNGASEIDMVINLGYLKSEKYGRVLSDIKEVRKAIGDDVVLKVIIETCYLTNEEKIRATEIVKDSGANFVKTSTGFGPKGADPFDVALLYEVASGSIKVKAAGGIRNYYSVCIYRALGAERIGTSSGIKIMEEI